MRNREPRGVAAAALAPALLRSSPDRKSTRLNSSHSQISYAVFCLNKKKFDRLRRLLHVLAACGQLMLTVSPCMVPFIGLCGCMSLNAMTKGPICTLLLNV